MLVPPYTSLPTEEDDIFDYFFDDFTFVKTGVMSIIRLFQNCQTTITIHLFGDIVRRMRTYTFSRINYSTTILLWLIILLCILRYLGTTEMLFYLFKSYQSVLTDNEIYTTRILGNVHTR